jgi:hypothetical protein
MRYDLDQIAQFAVEASIPIERVSENQLRLELGEGVTLLFLNAEHGEDDCEVGFGGTPWHSHGQLMFSNHQGEYIELDALDVVAGLADGDLLICESWAAGKMHDRWLIHATLNDEFRHLPLGEELRIRKFASKSGPLSSRA